MGTDTTPIAILFYAYFAKSTNKLRPIFPFNSGVDTKWYRTVTTLSSLNFRKHLSLQELDVLLVEPHSCRLTLHSSVSRVYAGRECPDLTKEPPGRTRYTMQFGSYGGRIQVLSRCGMRCGNKDRDMCSQLEAVITYSWESAVSTLWTTSHSRLY